MNCNECEKTRQGHLARVNDTRKVSNSLNYSITMNGVESCSHSCVYCSAATTLNYAQGVNYSDLENSLKKIDEKTYSEFRADFAKMEETIEQNTRFRRAKEIQEKQGVQAVVHIDLWGADPITCHLATQETVDFLKDFFENKHGMKLDLSSSTGGLPLARKDICDYYKENNMKMQISHDGCGQWMRTKDVDPLYDDRMADNIADLFKSGNLNLVNDCLNFYNGDVFANKKYWDDYFEHISLPMDKRLQLYIKLNRVYDGIYDIQKKNVNGIFGSDKRQWEELKGKPFGNMNHHNWKHANTGNIELDHLLAHELDSYLNDWLRIAIMMRDPKVRNDPYWKPYLSYLTEQVNRWRVMESHESSLGQCRRYQRAVHQLGDPKYWGKPNDFGVYENFVIDTTGKYCECNLIDGDHSTKNPGGFIEPEHCKYCKYYLQSECMGCGSEEINPDCEFRYRWVAMLEQVKLLDEVLKRNGDNAVEFNRKKIETEAYNKGRKDEHNYIANQVLSNFIQSPNSKLMVPQTSIQSSCNCKKPETKQEPTQKLQERKIVEPTKSNK